MKIQLEGFSSLGIGKELDLPSIAEIIRSPMFIRADIDDVYKYGGEFNRWLLDNSTIVNDKKHACVTVDLKLVSSGIMPMATSSWHCDGSNGCPYFSEDERFHIMIGHTDLVTDFIDSDYEWEFDTDISGMNHYEFRVFLQNSIGNILDLKSKKIPKNTFVSFNSHHVHRAPSSPNRPTFRLSVIIRESNFNQSQEWESAVQNIIHAWDEEKNQQVINMEWIERGIVLRNLRPF